MLAQAFFNRLFNEGEDFSVTLCLFKLLAEAYSAAASYVVCSTALMVGIFFLRYCSTPHFIVIWLMGQPAQ